MAEAFGMFGPTLSLCQVVALSLRQISELYKAPAEIQRLQEQLRLIHNAIERVQNTTDAAASDILGPALSKVRLSVMELDQLITTKLVHKGASSSRIRRRAWWSNRHKIVRLNSNLKTAREFLQEALSLDSNSCAYRIESTLASMNYHSKQIHDYAAIFDRLPSTQIAQVITPLLMDPIKAFPASNGSRNADEVLSSNIAADVGELKTDERAIKRPKTGFAQSEATNPVSVFEALPSFLPEMYSTNDMAHRFFSYYIEQIDETDFTRTLQCSSFYFKTPRRWTRLTLILTITFGSEYWSIAAAKTPVMKASQSLPSSLTTMLANSLKVFDNSKQVRCLRVLLDARSESFCQTAIKPLRVVLTKPPFDAEAYLRELTSHVYHMNCPRYFERELVQIPLGRDRPKNAFVAFLKGRWVLEYRFGSSKVELDSASASFQVLRCLSRGAPGINPLIGIVLDDQTGIITAFLCELPAKGAIFELIEKSNTSNQPIDWTRCRRWCRQIVEGVAEVHSKGFVVGYLAEIPCCGVAIDIHDNAVLFKRFLTVSKCDRNGREKVTIPPELRHLLRTESYVRASPQFDIYQLGLLLWRIAAWMNQLPWDPCEIAGCKLKAGKSCGGIHTALPKPGDRTPSYLQDVIAACRTEDPDERLPAWRLLEMFPEFEEQSIECSDTRKLPDLTRMCSPSNKSSNSHSNGLVRLEDCHEQYDHTNCCSLCFRDTTKHNFHCYVCDSGDLDLCHTCLQQGEHCLDPTHNLREYRRGSKEERYHTSVDESGQRHVIISGISHS